MWGFRGRRAKSHAAILGNTAIYFAHTVPTSKPIKLGKATKALLDAEVALTASWPTDDAPRLPPSLAKTEMSIERLRANRAWAASVIDWRSLVRESIAHPVTAFRVFRDIRGTRADVSVSEDDTPLDVLFEEAEKSLVELQAISVVERRMDEDLFWSEAGDKDSYVRFALYGTAHTVRIGDKTLKIALQPRVLLHRDGVVQVNVRVVLPYGCTPEEVIAASFLSEPLFTRSRIPEVYASRDTPWTGGEWDEDADGTVRMRVFDDEEEPATITDWLRVVTGRVLRVIDARQGGPMYTYPMILAQAGNCCDDWAKYHDADIVHLAVRSVARPGESLTLSAGRDLSIHSGVRVHATAGSMVKLELGPWESGLGDLRHTLLYERIGLAYVRLRALERRLSSFQTRGRQLLQTYRAVLDVEREVRGAQYRSGTTRGIASYVFEDLRVPATLTSIREATGMLSERAATRASLRAARAANRFAALGIIIAGIAAIPSLPAILELIEQQRANDPDGGIWAVVQILATSPLLLSALVLGVVAVYGVWFLVKVTVILAQTLWSVRKQGYPSRVRGYEITLDESA